MMTPIRNLPGSRPSFPVVAGLGVAAVWLALAGIIGALRLEDDPADGSVVAAAGDDDGRVAPTGPGGTLPSTSTPEAVPGEGTPGDGGSTGGPAAPGGPGTAPAPGQGSDGTGGPPGGGPGGPTPPGAGNTGDTSGDPGGTGGPPATGGDRTGVSDTEIKIGIHAPESIGGAPLNLAEDPIKGVRGYAEFINRNGGIHGRQLVLDIADDRYETSGGRDAATRLIENGNFLISGTLGVDQIQIVANEARKAGIPYLAAGGPEEIFRDIGMYQLATSYDTHVIQLARFLAQDPGYRGRKIGVTALDSPLIKPVVDVFVNEVRRVGMEVVEVVYIQKPTEQSSYTAQIQRLKDAGTEVLVPL